MSKVAIWLDRNTARIFRFQNHELREVNRFRGGEGDFEELVRELSEADALLLLGPGVAKHHFYNHLAEHHPSVARNIVGCLHVEDETDGIIASQAARYLTSRVPA